MKVCANTGDSHVVWSNKCPHICGWQRDKTGQETMLSLSKGSTWLMFNGPSARDQSLIERWGTFLAAPTQTPGALFTSVGKLRGPIRDPERITSRIMAKLLPLLRMPCLSITICLNHHLVHTSEKPSQSLLYSQLHRIVAFISIILIITIKCNAGANHTHQPLPLSWEPQGGRHCICS